MLSFVLYLSTSGLIRATFVNALFFASTVHHDLLASAMGAVCTSAHVSSSADITDDEQVARVSDARVPAQKSAEEGDAIWSVDKPFVEDEAARQPAVAREEEVSRCEKEEEAIAANHLEQEDAARQVVAVEKQEEGSTAKKVEESVAAKTAEYEDAARIDVTLRSQQWGSPEASQQEEKKVQQERKIKVSNQKQRAVAAKPKTEEPVILSEVPSLESKRTPHKFLLTSNGLTTPALKNEFRLLLGGSTENKTVWYLPTAPLRDGWSRGAVEAQVNELKRVHGFAKVKAIDVEYVKGEKLKKAIQKLNKVDVIYAEMGNTYNLRYHLRKSGGDALIRDAMDNGALYFGSSAGSIVAGKTVQMAFWKDWDDRTAQGTIHVNWKDPAQAQGLDLCNGRSMFPHANGEYAKKSWQDQQARRYGHDDHEVIKLADGEGFVIDGDKAYKVGLR